MIRPKNKKNKLKNIKRHIVFALFICIGSLLIDANTVSASTHLEETKIQLIDNAVGRYELNYTGNTNHFTTWFNTGDVEEQKIYDDVGGGWANSSSAYLTPQSENSTIKHAFLVWQSRTTEKEGYAPMEATIYFITPDNQIKPIVADYIIKDNRDNWDGKNYENYASMCTMVTDVTSIVRQSKFGKYSVCNIPMWQPSDASGFYMDGRYVYPGGDSPGSWQLVIVEESRDFEAIKAVSLSVTSEFHLGTDFTGELRLENGLKSTTTGVASGQFLFGLIRSTEGEHLVEHISTKDGNGNLIAEVTNHTIDRAGLFRDGVLQNNRDTAFGGACVDLSDVTDIGSGATSADLYVENGSLWTSFTMLGASFDVSYPDFEGIQTTTVNDDVTEVTVEGSFKNIAIPADTGIYDGNLEIVVDPELTPISAIAKVNGTLITTVPQINGNRVIFSGTEVRNMMNGDDISYTVLCTANSAGALEYKNEARFNGKLRSEGANTGYWVDQIWVASSEWEREVYKITLNPQGATTLGTRYYFEWYNHGNYTTEGCLQTIDTVIVPTKTNYNFSGYYTGANGTGAKYVDADGKILSTATTFTADTTLYAYWTPKVYEITLDNQGAQTAGTPCYYEKYSVGNYANANCTVSISTITKPVKDGYTFKGYYTQPNGGGNLYVTEAGAIRTSAYQFTQDATLYAYWTPNTYTITCNNWGASFGGSAYFNELYATNFYYDKTVLTAGTTDIPYNYTGGVQYFVAPYTGTYTLQVWGAQGGTQTFNGATGTGGLGGYSSGDVALAQGEVLYVYVGGTGQPFVNGSVTDANDSDWFASPESAGWNGGSFAMENNGLYRKAGGGGASDIRRYGNAYENRIIVAGGGGGGLVKGSQGANGSAGGGLNFTAPYNVDGGQASVDQGTGREFGYSLMEAGGGGWYGGGLYHWTNSPLWSGEGGTGYIGGVTNGNSVAGVRGGHGYAVVTRNNYTTQYTATTKIEKPTKEGHTFMGYYTGTNGTGQQVVDARGNILVANTYFKANTTVYAYWVAGNVALPETYTVHFNGNGATSGTMSSMVCHIGQSYQLNGNAFTRTNYTFKGWSTAPNGAVVYTDKQWFNQGTLGMSAGGSITLYAVWENGDYKIRFDGNGATSGSMADMSCAFGRTYNLTPLGYQKDGYTFIKWTTNRNGTGAEYADGATVSNLASTDGAVVTLYAQWSDRVPPTSQIVAVKDTNGNYTTQTYVNPFNNRLWFKDFLDAQIVSSDGTGGSGIQTNYLSDANSRNMASSPNNPYSRNYLANVTDSNGLIALEGYAVDRSGNTGVRAHGYFFVDGTAPIIESVTATDMNADSAVSVANYDGTIVITAVDSSDREWHNVDVLVDVGIKDNQAGLMSATLERYNEATGAWDALSTVSYNGQLDSQTASFVIEETGNYRVAVYDMLYHVAYTSETDYYIDKTPPTITVEPDNPDIPDGSDDPDNPSNPDVSVDAQVYGWINEEVPLHFDIAENINGSGIDTITFVKILEDGTEENIDITPNIDADAMNATVDVTISEEGITYYKMYAKDVAGNQSYIYVTVKIDYVAPMADVETPLDDDYKMDVLLKDVVEELSGCDLEETYFTISATAGEVADVLTYTFNPDDYTNIHTGASFAQMGIDIMSRYELCDSVDVEIHLFDIAGNEQIYTNTVDIFKLEATLYRYLSVKDGNTGDYTLGESWKAGESGLVKIDAGAFVDRIEVVYPTHWIEKQADDVTYPLDLVQNVYTYEPHVVRNHEEDEFMIPTGVDHDDASYTIVVRAYKVRNGVEKMKEVELPLVVDGSVLDDLKTRIRYK